MARKPRDPDKPRAPKSNAQSKRLDIIEQALSEDGGRLSDKFLRLSGRKNV